MSDDMSSLSPSSAGEQGVLRSMQEVAMSSRGSQQDAAHLQYCLVGQ